MAFTKKQTEDYMAGKLKLITSSKGSRLVPYKARPYDKGVTSPERRAYWRVWYLKNRARLMAARKNRVTLTSPSKTAYKVSPMTKAEKKIAKAAYAAKWRAKNLDKQKAYGKKMYHLKYSAAAKARLLPHSPACQTMTKPKSLWQKLFGWF